MNKTFILLTSVFAFFAILSCADTKRSASEPDWVYLFNGKDFTGFVQRGGEALYEVIDSAMVGTTVAGTPNSFMCTEQSYGDFILELDFMVDSNFNSGIQFRSLSYPEYQKGRVHGYQVEIDPSPRAWTAGIYDEARLGWLYPLNADGNEPARMAFRQNVWNHLRLEAIGPSMKTFLNGIPVANLLDETSPEGFIAFQVHSIYDSSMIGKQVRWKNIRIATENLEKFSTPSNAPEKSYLINRLSENELKNGYKLLFDGSTVNGWRRAYDDKFPEKGWEVKDGILTVLKSDGAESRNGGDIVTVDEYSNFDLSLQVKYTPGANSGIKYFVTESEKNNPGSAIGPEYQILDDFLHPDAKLGAQEGSRTLASLYDLIKAENKRRNEVGQWNNVRILSSGNHVEHWLNGFKVLEYERGSDAFRKLVSESKYKVWPAFGEAPAGHILLQDHGDEVSFRSIKIRVPALE